MAPLQDMAHAKINLFLHVTGRREDGYHLLDSLAVFAGAGDRVTLSAASGDEDSLTLHGPFSEGLEADDNNLVLRAAKALRHEIGTTGRTLPAAALRLEKHLPVASGIGGGSADAACALRLLARHWQLPDDMAPRAAPTLGADVPVCLVQKATRMEGIGDILTPAPALPEMGILLVNPGVSVSTPSIFRRLAATGGITPRPALSFPETGWPTLASLIAFLDTTENDLQPHAIAQEPVIATVLERLAALPDVRFSRMSGSGATCFALFDSADKAMAAARHLAGQDCAHGWWHWAGPVLP
ncbi:4-(cytidine 5'-diphospho)-2-C-methyl-D-erythritol kinase [Bombella mellum]|uniref:4-diphosphocytidyl-2-C-methyl-D-erythritol kinase n=1 Tax=Bombella mellum TaxID=2039288 RepID=A0ABR5ZT81_9PROT|nr:4-(cytidine 5'-diphospho)-2-C-methyl-D-erythritol kinase [Bombella mellum]MBA5727506.1 4-(cytidine 5'-diphospho)-2-C-methyl-D-erythritol kinase [Bombella mellum]